MMNNDKLLHIIKQVKEYFIADAELNYWENKVRTDEDFEDVSRRAEQLHELRTKIEQEIEELGVLDED